MGKARTTTHTRRVKIQKNTITKTPLSSSTKKSDVHITEYELTVLTDSTECVVIVSIKVTTNRRSWEIFAIAPVGLGNNGGDVSVAVCTSLEKGHKIEAHSPNLKGESLLDR